MGQEIHLFNAIQHKEKSIGKKLINTIATPLIIMPVKLPSLTAKIIKGRKKFL